MKTYRIAEIETNVLYDDTYNSLEEADAVVERYKADDKGKRDATYLIIVINDKER